MNLDEAINHTMRMTVVPCGNYNAEYRMYANYLHELRDARRRLGIAEGALRDIVQSPSEEPRDMKSLAVNALRRMGIFAKIEDEGESLAEVKERIKQYLIKMGWSTSYDGNPAYDFFVNHSETGMEYVVALRKDSVTERELRVAIEGIAGFYMKEPFQMKEQIMRECA